jgi:hypothetical protein
MRTRREKCVRILGTVIIMLACGAAATSQDAKPAPGQPTAGAVQSSNSAVAGEWQGAVSRLRLVVKIEPAVDGSLKGTLTSVDQGNVSIPIDTVSFQADGSLRLDLKSIGAAYEGKLNSDGSEVSGTWQQGGASVALLCIGQGHPPSSLSAPESKAASRSSPAVPRMAISKPCAASTRSPRTGSLSKGARSH